MPARKRSTSLEVLPSPAPWYEGGLRFQCTQCGNCCSGPPGYVWLSDAEISRFATHLNLTREIFVRTYCRVVSGRISLREKKNLRNEFDCIFLAEREVDGKRHRGCTVYEVRPLQCRTWPFWDGLLQDSDSWNSAAVKCPGMNRGKHYTLDQIASLRDAADWPDQAVTPGSAKKKNSTLE